jgi:hypothetical protein
LILDGSEQISEQLAPIFREPIFEKQLRAIFVNILSQPLTEENLIKHIKIAYFLNDDKMTRALTKAIVDNYQLYRHFRHVLSKSDELMCFSDELTTWCKYFKYRMQSIFIRRYMYQD